MSFLFDNSISIFFATETWIDEPNNATTAKIKSYGYKIIHHPRSSFDKTRGEGVAIIYNKCFNLTKFSTESFKSFESVSAKFKCEDGKHICCSCVYRPGIISNVFFEEFDEYIEEIFVKFSNIVICGDFNIHLDNQNHHMDLSNSYKKVHMEMATG